MCASEEKYSREEQEQATGIQIREEQEEQVRNTKHDTDTDWKKTLSRTLPLTDFYLLLLLVRLLLSNCCWRLLELVWLMLCCLVPPRRCT
jgi:hypothetical protein